MTISVCYSQNIADNEILIAVTNMIGPDLNVDHLATSISSSGFFAAKNEPTANLKQLVDTCYYNPLAIMQPPSYPYKRLTPLLYCNNCKVASLTFTTNINDAWGTATADAMIAVKDSSVVTLRQAFGTAICTPKQQFTLAAGRMVVRGLFTHELEALQDKLQRESALAMKREISAKTGLSAGSELDLASLYLDESSRLRSLYPQIEYDYTELDRIEPQNLGNTIFGASLGRITDASIISRIQTIAQASTRSSFLFAAAPNIFFVGAITNHGSHFLLKFSTFGVRGKLPTSAFAISVGSWNVERHGEAASPSLAQLLAIFPAIKA
jgi:hypothetical protein